MKAAANRRRSKQQIAEARAQEQLQRQETAERLARLEQMQQQLQEAQERVQRVEHLASCAQEMINVGVLRQEANGTLSLVDDQAERESLQAQHAQERQEQEDQQRRERRQAQLFQSAEGVSEAQVDDQFLDANQ